MDALQLLLPYVVCVRISICVHVWLHTQGMCRGREGAQGASIALAWQCLTAPNTATWVAFPVTLGQQNRGRSQTHSILV